MNTTDDFQPVLDLVAASPISDGVKRTIAWCIGQLPALYGKFGETHDVYFSDKIAHLEVGVIKELGKEKKSDHAQKLTENVLVELKTIHEKHGLQSLDPKPAKPKKVRGK